MTPSTSRDESLTPVPYAGKNCPVGMVQVEFVGCLPEQRYSDYGWKPVVSAFLEIYVDGQRFRLDVGTFHDGRGTRRGIHIVTEADIHVEPTAVNAASIWLDQQE